MISTPQSEGCLATLTIGRLCRATFHGHAIQGHHATAPSSLRRKKEADQRDDAVSVNFARVHAESYMNPAVQGCARGEAFRDPNAQVAENHAHAAASVHLNGFRRHAVVPRAAFERVPIVRIYWRATEDDADKA